MRHRPLSLVALAAPILGALAGCAIHIVQEAAPGRQSDDTHTVISGRMNYVIDGQLMVPYGMTRPRWPAPFMEAVDLRTGEVHAFPAVEPEQGRFRWRVAPGAYVVTRIGFGSFTDDTYIAWPKVALCVPRAPGRTVHVGHLRLEGTRYDEELTLSTGTRSRSRGVRYRFEVADESAGEPDAARSLMRHLPELPTGDRLQQRWKEDAAGLQRQACGNIGA
jgi:hypothetical protein